MQLRPLLGWIISAQRRPRQKRQWCWGSEFISPDETVLSSRGAACTLPCTLECCRERFLSGSDHYSPQKIQPELGEKCRFFLCLFFGVFFPFSFKLLQSVSVLEYWQFNRVLLPHRSTSIRQLLEPAVEIRSHLNTIENNQRCH